MTLHIRRAGSGDSDTVLVMMQEIAAHEGVGEVGVTADRWRELLDRDDLRLGAVLRTKVAAGWHPHRYTELLASDVRVT